MQKHPIYDEKECLNRIALGDQLAFRSLVDEFWRKVYGHALSYAKSSSLAQEITQDIFLKLWQQRLKLPEVQNFRTYLFVLGRNHIISAMRKNLSTVQLPLENVLLEDVLLPDQQLQWKDAERWLQRAVEALPPARKKVFKMSRYEGKSHDAIAEELGISKNTVKQHIVLALNSLRAHMKNYNDAWLVLYLLIMASEYQ